MKRIRGLLGGYPGKDKYAAIFISETKVTMTYLHKDEIYKQVMLCDQAKDDIQFNVYYKVVPSYFNLNFDSDPVFSVEYEQGSHIQIYFDVRSNGYLEITYGGIVHPEAEPILKLNNILFFNEVK